MAAQDRSAHRASDHGVVRKGGQGEHSQEREPRSVTPRKPRGEGRDPQPTAEGTSGLQWPWDKAHPRWVLTTWLGPEGIRAKTNRKPCPQQRGGQRELDHVTSYLFSKFTGGSCTGWSGRKAKASW